MKRAVAIVDRKRKAEFIENNTYDLTGKNYLLEYQSLNFNYNSTFLSRQKNIISLNENPYSCKTDSSSQEQVETIDEVELHDIVGSAIILNQSESFKQPFGEFDDIGADISTQSDRLYNFIEELIDQVCVAQQEKIEREGCNPNRITRLISNEFMFYTKEPLTLAQFEAIINKILNYTSTKPENLHLILSSFAVLTPAPNSTVMNVTPFIESGPQPKLRLIVKEHPSNSDPKYYIHIGDTRYSIPNNASGVHPLVCSIQTQDGRVPFSNDKIFTCKTVGDRNFLTFIEICADHGTAYAHFRKQLTSSSKASENGELKAPISIPRSSSHVVASNCIQINPSWVLGHLRHAKPDILSGASRYVMNQSLDKVYSISDLCPTFGTPLKLYNLHSENCELLPQYFRCKIDIINANVERRQQGTDHTQLLRRSRHLAL